MFNWLRGKPRCPVCPQTKEWIEWRFNWLVEQLGLDRLKHGQIILPSNEFFPDANIANDDAVHDLMLRVAKYMDVDSSRLRLSFYEDSTSQLLNVTGTSSTGLYLESGGVFNISLERNSMTSPENVVAVLAHEIGHVVLLGQRRVSPEEVDNEELTDLTTVFLGLGIFSANSAFFDSSWSSGQMEGWTVGRQGYLSMDIYGYTMALQALARGERDPDWAKYLRPDVRAPLKRGIRYITETQDCDFLPALEYGITNG